jgi:hypothetical protein
VIGQHLVGQRVPQGPGQEAGVPGGAPDHDLRQRLDQRGNEVDRPRGGAAGVEGGDPAEAPFVDRAHPGGVHGGHEAGPVPEVVLGGHVVALAGGAADLAEGDGLQAPFGEQSLGRLDDGAAGQLSPVHHRTN